MPDIQSALRHSKLQRPRIIRSIVGRPRLWSLLDEGTDRPLTLVCAGPGFGKTTLVSSWLARRESMAHTTESVFGAWLSLDERDGDLSTFLTYLIAALRAQLGDVCSNTLAMLHSTQQPVADTVYTSLVNELLLLPSPVILVLDDYSEIKSDAPTEFLRQLLRSWPQRLHLILITRRNPALSLPTLRASDAIVEVRSGDLRFTPAETREYLAHILDAPYAEAAVASYDQQIEGWIAGIKLAVMATRGMPDRAALHNRLTGSVATLAEYLTDEVMTNQPWPVQQFLLETSILDHFSASLAAAVISAHDEPLHAGACIAALVSADLFIVALDPEHEWYRYHHLFRDFLRRQLRRSATAQQIGELHRRAANWYAAHNLIDAALSHALEAQDLDLASRLLSQAIYDVLNREDRATLDRWLTMLPKEFIQSRPELLLLQAWSLQFAWQLPAQQRLLETIEAQLEQNTEPIGNQEALEGLRVQVAALRGEHAYYALDFAGAIAHWEHVLAKALPTWTYLRGAAMLFLGMSIQASGDFARAQRMLVEELDRYQDKGDGYALRICEGLCFAYVAEGKLELARQTALDMLHQAETHGLVTMEAWARYFLGLVHYLWNELEIAGTYLQGIVAKRNMAILVAVQESLSLLVLVHAHLGQCEEALQALEMMRELDLSQNGRETESTRCTRARLQALTGEIDRAGRWADAFVQPIPVQPVHWVSNPHAAMVRILLARRARGDLDRARRIVADIHEIATRTHNTRFTLEMLVMRAVVDALQEETTSACAILAEAFDLAASGGFTRIFLDFGDVLQPLLVHMSARGAQLRKVPPGVMALLPQPDDSHAANSRAPISALSRLVALPELVDPLTVRELEVLALLREPLSTKEIARRLYVSPATVKRHTINIYGKLGVNRRWDAIAKAETLRLISSR